MGNSCQERELVDALRKDEIAKKLYVLIENNWCDDNIKMCEELNKLYCVRHRLTSYGELIFFDSRVYIPRDLRLAYLARCHEGHQGITKCRRAQEVFWWPGISTDIADYINKCEICIKASRVKHQPADDSPLPEKPWVELGSDLFELDHKLYLLVVDYYSRWS